MCKVWGKGFRVQSLGFRVQGLEFRIQGLQFRVEGLGCRVYPHSERQVKGEAHAAGGVALDGCVAVPLGELAHREPVGWLVSCLSGWLINWWVNCFISWLAG